MKKLVILLLVAFCATSCYNSRVYVGNVTKTEPLVKVNKQWNSQFIGGLVTTNSAKMAPIDYLNGAENYMVRTHTTFLNGLVSVATFGIYTPTQTTFYLPLKDAPKAIK